MALQRNIPWFQRHRDLILSLCLHSTWLLLAWAGTFWHYSPDKKTLSEVIELSVLNEKNAQVVHNITQVNEEVPDKTRFNSEKNQRVLKEMQAEGSEKLSQVLMRRRQKLAPSQKQTASEEREVLVSKKSNSTAKNLVQKAASNFDKPLSLTQLANVQAQKISPSAPTFNPNYIKNLEKGPLNLLNTKSFAYYYYYERIQRQLEHQWRDDVKKRITSLIIQGRSLAAVATLTTKLVVGLDTKGHVKKLFLISKSGEQSLDNSALDAFKRAGPFPNPPKELVESDGFIYIQWNFIVES